MIIKSEQEMLNFGKEFASRIISQNGPIVIELIGDVGAGKTTFTRGLAKGLGIKEEITSPSFTVSKSYSFKTKEGEKTLTHYDFYRLPDPGLMVEDLSENLQNPKNITIVEWGESVKDLLPKGRYTIKIDYNESAGRELFFEEGKTL